VVEVYQTIYNAIKAVGVTPTIAEIDSLVQSAKRQSTADFINSYIKGKLVQQLAPYQLNGVQMSQEFFMNGVVLPDTTGIKTALQPVWGYKADKVFEGDAKSARLNLLSLANDVISAVAGADATIASLFTYYTQSDASAAMAAQLQAVADALNTFDAANGAFMGKKVPTIEFKSNQGYYESTIPGLAVDNGTFVLSLDFIRKYEQFGSLNFFSSYNSVMDA
jgi:hypothetical protein